MLEQAGWVVQDGKQVNLAAAGGVAVREFVLGRRTAGRLPAVRRPHAGRRSRGEEGGEFECV